MRTAPRFVVAALVALVASYGGLRLQAQASPTDCGLTMRLLVVSADGNEVGLPALRQTLDYLGTPYHLHVATANPGGLTPTLLGSGCRANFHGVILATADVGYFEGTTWKVALSATEFQALETFEAQFRVRRATWYTYPTADRGFTVPTGTSTERAPIPVTLTAAGRGVFPYVNATASIPIEDAYVYLAKPFDAATTPLLVDSAGNALAAIKTYPDGRENLALTFDGNPYLLHSVLLGHGVVNWVTRGLFIGERHVYASPQVDDLFLGNNEWLPTTPCGTPPDDNDDGRRITGADLQAIAEWQARRNLDATTAQLKLSMPFNGEGTTGIYPNDTLTSKARSLQGKFHWINHTYSHPVLDDLDYRTVYDELTWNNDIGVSMGFASFSIRNLITPEISGLTNPAAMKAAADAGVRYVVSDTSRPGYANPFPNNGIANPLQPSILMIPRRANNLFYNASTPEGWAAEYNCLYRSYWGRDLTYAEVVAVESEQLLMHLLRGENDPWMFHQVNMAAYDGRRTLLTDLLDRTFDRYNSLVTLPVLSPAMDALGDGIRRRMAYLAGGVTGTIQPGIGVTIAAAASVTAPVTGLNVAGAESYGGQKIARVSVAAGGSAAYSAPHVWPLSGSASGSLPAGWSHGDIGTVGAAGHASYDPASGEFTISGGGADVWGSADAFHFAYQPLSGDGRIQARVSAVSNTHAWVKAGVMIRATLQPGSTHGFMLVSPSKGLAFQRRATTGGSSVSSAGAAATAPYWVRLDRTGNVLRAYQSANGTTWTLVGSHTIAMGAAVQVGLGVSSHIAGTLATATFDNVTVTVPATTAPGTGPGTDPGTTPTLPDGWSTRDIGSAGVTGSATYDAASSTFSVKGAGADVWGTADAFRFTYRTLAGDGAIVARVATVQNTNAWVKAGVMIRESLTAGSAHAFMLVSPGKGTAFQRRAAAGGTSVNTAGPFTTAPYWVKLQRSGAAISAFTSPDGSAWTLVGSHSIPMAATVHVGLAVSSHSTSVAATATFTNVSVP
jgi:regulation of enolase protein 1 (concanavalin A-like superfamily)